MWRWCIVAVLVFGVVLATSSALQGVCGKAFFVEAFCPYHCYTPHLPA